MRPSLIQSQISDIVKGGLIEGNRKKISKNRVRIEFGKIDKIKSSLHKKFEK